MADLIERLRDAQAAGVGSAKLFNLIDEAAAALEAAREDAAVFAEKVDGVASFLVGYGDVAEFAAKNLRDALFEYDAAIDQARGKAGQEVGK
jgi:hypothetical protein